EEGPRITLSFASGSTIVKPDAQLRVDLTDPSGILITGHSLQNGIVVTLDENTTARVDITPSFRYLNGSHITGNAFWNLPNLASGPHTIKVSPAHNLAPRRAPPPQPAGERTPPNPGGGPPAAPDRPLLPLPEPDPVGALHQRRAVRGGRPRRQRERPAQDLYGLGPDDPEHRELRPAGSDPD